MKHVIFNTDIGFDPDDFVALLFALNQPNIKIELIVSNEDPLGRRATYLQKILKAINRTDIPIVRGNQLRNWYADQFLPAIDLDPTIPVDYIDQIHNVIRKFESVEYVGLGSLTDLADYITFYGISPKMTLTQMGSSTYRREFNFGMNLNAAIKVITNPNMKIRLVASEITGVEQLSVHGYSDLFHKFHSHKEEPVYQLLLDNIERYYSLFHNEQASFNLHDPLTFATLLSDRYVTFEPHRVQFEEVSADGDIDGGPIAYCIFTKDEKSLLQYSIKADYQAFMEFILRCF